MFAVPADKCKSAELAVRFTGNNKTFMDAKLNNTSLMGEGQGVLKALLTAFLLFESKSCTFLCRFIYIFTYVLY